MRTPGLRVVRRKHVGASVRGVAAATAAAGFTVAACAVAVAAAGLERCC